MGWLHWNHSQRACLLSNLIVADQQKLETCLESKRSEVEGRQEQEGLQLATGLAMTRHFQPSDAICCGYERACDVYDDGAYDAYASRNSSLLQQNQ